MPFVSPNQHCPGIKKTTEGLTEWLCERTEHLDIFLFSAHHWMVFYFRCSVYWWRGVSDFSAAENLPLYRVVRFFHPRSSCTTTHISTDVQRITWNASCMTISGGRTKQLDIMAGFLPGHWLYEWLYQFHSCGTYSILSRSPSVVTRTEAD